MGSASRILKEDSVPAGCDSARLLFTGRQAHSLDQLLKARLGFQGRPEHGKRLDVDHVHAVLLQTLLEEFQNAWSVSETGMNDRLSRGALTECSGQAVKLDQCLPGTLRLTGNAIDTADPGAGHGRIALTEHVLSGFVGLCQFNVEAPPGILSGKVALKIASALVYDFWVK